MDHLIQASDSIQKELVVPYYGNPSFERFWMANPVKVDIDTRSAPQNVKVTVYDQIGSIMTLTGLHDLTAFFQAWTFFGLLRTFLETQPLIIDMKRDFILQNDTGYFVTTRSLQRVLAICRLSHECVGSFSDLSSVANHHKITEKLRDVYHELIQGSIESHLIYLGRREPSLDNMEKVHLTTILLTETLLQYVTNTGSPLNEKTFLMRSFRQDLLPIIKERFFASGWCPSDFGKLNQYDSPSLLFSLSSIPRWEARKKDHRLCTTDKCRLKIQESLYESSHTSTCNGCETIGIDPELVSSIWERRSIPIIRVVQTTHPTLSIAEFDLNDIQNPTASLTQDKNPKEFKTSSPQYTAISHVWSQGLGNPAQNALPSCQLFRLQSLVDEHSSSQPVYFWIDTICVPVQGSSRKTAIKNMRHVYQEASRVLVIDKTLIEFDPLTTNTGEILLRIYGSPWNRRLWTYQEAILAKNLTFKFKSVLLNLTSAIQLDEEAIAKRPELESLSSLRKPQLGNQGLLWLVLDPAVSRVTREFNSYGKITFGWREGEIISQIATHLSTRRTTHARDEPICIATALGLDVEAVLASRVDERMEFIFHKLEQVPANILFSMRPHHKAVGSRWIPKSLLWDPNSSPIQSTQFGHVTESGLLVYFPGWLFKGDQGSLSINMQKVHRFSLRHNEHTYAAEIQSTGEVPLDSWTPKQYGLILPQGQLPDLNHLDRNNVHMGLLVTVTSDDKEVIYCLRLSVVYVRLWSEKASIAQDAIMEFSIVVQDQKWCVR